MEKPIIFSTEMVRAILEGRKTQTRRVIRFPGRDDSDWVKSVHQDASGDWIAWSTDEPGLAEFTKKAYPNGGFKCPYGRINDRLWVKETWATHPTIKKAEPGTSIFYRADDLNESHYSWRSPIYMPLWASRITLEILAIRPERLQDISEADAQAEGIDPYRTGKIKGTNHSLSKHYRIAYADLWNRINEKRGFGFELNPWVWKIDFRRGDKWY